jgi:tol-pal system protein YbgF
MKRHAGFHALCIFMWVAAAGVIGALGVVSFGAAGYAQGKKAGGGDSEVEKLRRRVEQLEEQLVDMRVVIGTLQSLAKAPAQGGSVGQPSFQGGGGDQGGRLTILETQIRALTAQVERMNARIKALGGGSAPAAPGGFGSTTVQPQPQSNDSGDRIGNFITQHVAPSPGGRSGGSSAGNGAAAQDQFDAAYNSWLQGDVNRAQEGFRDFLNSHPRSKLAGEAHYWLGETYYQQGRFKVAAKEFLTVSQSFEGSRLAPDSLYKLALSLNKLGQAKAACSTLGELPQRYPQAPWGVLRKAAAHERRLGC